MELNNVSIHSALGEVLGPRLIELAFSHNLSGLKKLGLSKASYTQLKTNIPTTINQAIASSIVFKIDEQLFHKNLSSLTALYENNNLLLSWISKGVNYSMCREFFVTHTKNKHSAYRDYMESNNVVGVIPYLLSQKEAQEFKQFIWNIEQANDQSVKRKLSAVDIDCYSNDNELPLMSLWKVYKEYRKDEQ